MDTKDITTAKDPGLRASMAAMQRAAALARKTAIQTDTHSVIMEGKKLVRVSADDLRQIDSSLPQPKISLRGALKNYADSSLRIPLKITFRNHRTARQAVRAELVEV
ncbi:MAG: hypothetical protein HOP23_11870 [Methylococcaceae bacterium]|nr:hypothetical protein [Methylococcaceae bacterium]